MFRIQKILLSLALSTVCFVSLTFAQKGIILGDASENQKQCTEKTLNPKDEIKLDSGIIVLLTGIIVLFTGDQPDCGIIIL